MISRRTMLRLGTVALAATLSGVSARAADAPRKLLFIHGRGQGGQDPQALRATWIKTLQEGAQKIGRDLPESVDVTFPFYGDKLDEFARASQIPLTVDIQTRGERVDEEFLRFQAEIAEEMRRKAGITDEQINAEYGPNPKPRGPENWEWVQAILSALDRHGGGLSQGAIEAFMRDVFLYTTRAGVRDEIDRIVAAALSEAPTVVVGHSLGSVVAYNVLRSDRRKLDVPLFVTVGSPLGIRAIRDEFRPLRFPPAKAWFNAYDERDVVALYALDSINFPVTPAIINHSKVDNVTDNRHGIIGYLDDRLVAGQILDGLGV